jgi:hypothetical protein
MMDDLTQQFNIPQVKLITSTLNNFIIQPSSLTLYAQNIMFASMLPMKVTILFTHKGGVKVGDVNAKALILSIPIHSTFPCVTSLPPSSSTSRLQKLKATLVDFLTHLYSVYIDLYFAYLTINHPSILMPWTEANQQSITPSWLPSLYLRTQVGSCSQFQICPYTSLPARLLAPRAKCLVITVPYGEFQLKKCDSLIVVLSNYFL